MDMDNLWMAVSNQGNTNPSWPRCVVNTTNAPAAIGPYYSQAYMITYRDYALHIAGQIGMSPTTGELVPGGITAEAHQAMMNIQAILNDTPNATFFRNGIPRFAKCGLPRFDFTYVTECTVSMADLTESAAFNQVYAGFFDDDPPAPAAVQVAALPLGARVEIKCNARAR